MKFIIVILFVIIYLPSCDKHDEYINCELRQLVSSEKTSEHASAFFVLGFGAYDESKEQVQTIECFAKIKGVYVYKKFPLTRVSINIDNSIMKPTMILHYQRIYIESGPNDDVNLYEVTINCPERYLPEKLLPIEL